MDNNNYNYYDNIIVVIIIIIVVIIMIIVVIVIIIIIIVHSTKLLNFDWSRAVQLIPNCTPQEYLLSFHGNDVILLNVL